MSRIWVAMVAPLMFAAPLARADGAPDCSEKAQSAVIGKDDGRRTKFMLAYSACTKRVARRAELVAQINAMAVTDWYESAADGTLATAGDDMATAVADLATVSAGLGVDFPSAADADKMIAAARTQSKIERACRDAPKCMAARAAAKREALFFDATVAPMCMADKDRERAQADIARERANPGGVVDLDVLHTDGEFIQEAQQRIRELAPAYVAMRKHAFSGWRSECQ